METAEPASYDFPGHAMGGITHRRPMDSTLSQNFPFYSHQTGAPYSLSYHAPSSLPYNFGHSVGHTHVHSNPYQQYFVPSQHSIQPQPLRLTTEQPLQSLPEIRPAKNAISQTAKAAPDYGSRVQISTDRRPPDGAASETKQNPADIAFSTNVDVLMKAIQAKHAASTQQQSLPPLQHLAPTALQTYPVSSYAAASPPPPRYYSPNEGQLSRSGKKRKYNCSLPGCGKSFAQKTHLDIHIRAHTGDKPFVSEHQSCIRSVQPYLVV
jgi:hypothetical protein